MPERMKNYKHFPTRLLQNNNYKTSAFCYYENILDARLPSSGKSTKFSLGAAVKAWKNKCHKCI